jgi:predicted transcriptional regulator
VELTDSFGKKIPNKEGVELVIKKLLRHYKLGKANICFTSGRNRSCASRWQITINMDDGNDFGTVVHEIAHMLQAKKGMVKQKLQEDGTTKFIKQKWHSNKHKRIIARILAYCEKKGYWQQDIEKRMIKYGYLSDRDRYSIKCVECDRKVCSSEAKFQAQNFLEYEEERAKKPTLEWFSGKDNVSRTEPNVHYQHHFIIVDNLVKPAKQAKPEPTKDELRVAKILHLQQLMVKYERKVSFYQHKVSKTKRRISAVERATRRFAG